MTEPQLDEPSPATPLSPRDPAPRSSALDLELDSGERVVVRDDHYSDRIRCDHPQVQDGGALARALLAAAREQGRERVVALVPSPLCEAMHAEGLAVEGVMPGFYRGEQDCVVFRGTLSPRRAGVGDPMGVSRVRALFSRGPDRPRSYPDALPSERASPELAGEIADLVARSFTYYPTPSGVPDYIRRSIEQGIPFRVVRDDGRVVACASADLVPQAGTAELTDCATDPAYRGRGLMQEILLGLMDDLRALGHPTAFTLARAVEPGMNIAFRRLGFEYRGTMNQSCRIGEGLEDINIWSRPL